MRLENPELSLSELAEVFDPPVTKSGLNHRFRKIMETCGKDREVDICHLYICMFTANTAFLDGACRIKGLIARAKELGQKAVAITDHGVMYGVINFYKEAKAQGIKPIIGCEVYVAPQSRFDKEGREDARGNHLVLLCKNETGL